MRIPSIAPRDAQRDIHLVLDYFGGRPGSPLDPAQYSLEAASGTTRPAKPLNLIARLFRRLASACLKLAHDLPAA
jgi:hypothetical protein